MPSFFQLNKPKSFQFKPRYYSEEKERIEDLKRRIGEEKANEEERADRLREALQKKRSHRHSPKGALSRSRWMVYILLLFLLILLINNASWLLR